MKTENIAKCTGRAIQIEDFTVESDGNAFEWMDHLFGGEGGWNVALAANCNVDELFGTHVATDENMDYLNIYANLRPWLVEVDDKLKITLCKDNGEDVPMERDLSEKEQLMILHIVQNALPELVNELCRATGNTLRTWGMGK